MRALSPGVVIIKETSRNIPKLPIALFIMSVILSHEFHRLRKYLVNDLAVYGSNQ